MCELLLVAADAPGAPALARLRRRLQVPYAILDGLDAARARPAHQPLESGLVEAQQAHTQNVVVRSLYHHSVLHVRVHLLPTALLLLVSRG
eukprot:2995610-Prymnesium_polylepis.1